ncbi:hypothetical protein [Klebsiella electrica]
MHHINLISEGGELFNFDNMLIVTPRLHIKTHSNFTSKSD